MEVVYNGVKITSQNPPYQELLLSETINQPIVTITPNPSRYSSLIMYDPHSVKGIFIHWLVINIPITANNINSGQVIKSYYKPSPPPKTGKHRYMFELYSHVNKLQVDKQKEINYSNVSKLLSDNPNAKLVKKLVFLSENKSQTGGKKYIKYINKRRSIRRKVYSKKTRRLYKY
jgi:phosphatidylethanolamine-binding protein (PEBP) family uncharacterized protein